MGFMALLFVLFNSFLPKIFSTDDEIVFIASKLLLFAALFQLFDGTQVLAIGALRGLEDYKYPTTVAFVGYWLIALPLCYVFAFMFKLEVYGVWLALSIGLAVVSIALYLRIQALLKLKSYNSR